MSDFVDALVDLLPEHNSLKSKRNPLRQVLDKSVGEWFDNHSVQTFYDNLFLQSATGGWLDLHGRDYGVYRRIGETDEDYRRRIVFEKLDYLTADNLKNIYGVELYNFVDGFNPFENDLTSDNPYLSNFYFGVADENTQAILNNKFILEDSILWFDIEELDYIFNTSNQGLLKNYRELYEKDDLYEYFKDNTTLKKVKLTLPNVTRRTVRTFQGCTGLTDVKLYLPNCTYQQRTFRNCTALVNAEVYIPSAYQNYELFRGCTSLKNVILDMSMAKLETGTSWDIFVSCTALETINVTMREDLANGFADYVDGLNLSNLTSLVINGVEYID